MYEIKIACNYIRIIFLVSSPKHVITSDRCNFKKCILTHFVKKDFAVPSCDCYFAGKFILVLICHCLRRHLVSLSHILVSQNLLFSDMAVMLSFHYSQCTLHFFPCVILQLYKIYNYTQENRSMLWYRMMISCMIPIWMMKIRNGWTDSVRVIVALKWVFLGKVRKWRCQTVMQCWIAPPVWQRFAWTVRGNRTGFIFNCYEEKKSSFIFAQELVTEFNNLYLM